MEQNGIAKDIYMFQRLAIWVFGTIVITVAVASIYALIAHLLVPHWGWLTAEEQSRIAGLYQVLAQIAFPVVTGATGVPLVRRLLGRHNGTA